MSAPPRNPAPNDVNARCELELKVIPGAKRDEIAGWLGDALKIRVSAPPEKGRANEAVVRLLADALGVDARGVRVVSGASSPRKRVRIEGLGDEELRERIESCLGSDGPGPTR